MGPHNGTKETSRRTTVTAVVVAGLVGVSTFAAPYVQAAKERTSIVDVALQVNAETGEFATLIAAVVAANLVPVLDANRQFTVFAPTDAAFAELGLDASNIGSMDKAALTSILLYHVAPGSRPAEDVLKSEKIRTIAKKFLAVRVAADGAFVNDAKILMPDVLADNGVIHVIDAVLLP
jgi:uncharacterized surface protein with fasciclin (FAS1) repeats